jgi:hypothetical protein
LRPRIGLKKRSTEQTKPNQTKLTKIGIAETELTKTKKEPISDNRNEERETIYIIVTKMTPERNKTNDEDNENGVAKVDEKLETQPEKHRAPTDEIGNDCINRTEEWHLQYGPPYSPRTEHLSLQPPPKKHKVGSPGGFPEIGKLNGNEPASTPNRQSTPPRSANPNATEVLVQYLNNLVETEIENATTLLKPTPKPADTNNKYDRYEFLQEDAATLNKAAAKIDDDGDRKPAAAKNHDDGERKPASKTLTNIGSNKMPSEMAKWDPLLGGTWQLKRLYRTQEPEQIRFLEPPSITANETETGKVVNRKEFTEEELEALEMRAKFRSVLQSSNKSSSHFKKGVRHRRCRFAASTVAHEIIAIDSDIEQSQQRNRNLPDVTLAATEDVDMIVENYWHMGLTTIQSPRMTHWEARMDKALQVNIPPEHMRLYLQELLKAPPGTTFSTVAFSVPPHTKFEVIPPSSKNQHQSLQWLNKKYSEEVHPHTFYDNVSISTHLASLIPAIMDITLTKQDKTGACLVHKRHQYDSMVVQAILDAVPFLVRFKRQATTKLFTLYKFDSTKLSHLIKRIEMSGWYIAKERTPAVKKVDAKGTKYEKDTEFLYNLLDFAYPVNAQNLYTAEAETLWYIPRHIADWVFLFPQQVSETYYANRLQNSFVPPPKAKDLYSCK